MGSDSLKPHKSNFYFGYDTIRLLVYRYCSGTVPGQYTVVVGCKLTFMLSDAWMKKRSLCGDEVYMWMNLG